MKLLGSFFVVAFLVFSSVGYAPAQTCNPRGIEELPLLFWPLPNPPEMHDDRLLPFNDPWCNHNLHGFFFEPWVYSVWDTIAPLQEAYDAQAQKLFYCWGTDSSAKATHQHVGTDFRRIEDKGVLLTDEDVESLIVGDEVFPIFKGEVRIIGERGYWKNFVVIRHEVDYISGFRPCTKLRFWSLYWHLDISPSLELYQSVDVDTVIGTVADLVDTDAKDVDHLHLTLILDEPPDSNFLAGSVNSSESRERIPTYLGVYADFMATSFVDYKEMQKTAEALKFNGKLVGYSEEDSDVYFFRPTNFVSRAELVSFICYFFPVPSREIPELKQNAYEYGDINSDDHSGFAGELGYLTTRGVVKGYGDNQFKPKRYISRAEFIKILIAASENIEEYDYGEWENMDLGANFIGFEDWWWIKWLKKAKLWEIKEGRRLLPWKENLLSPDLVEAPILRTEVVLILRSYANIADANSGYHPFEDLGR